MTAQTKIQIDYELGGTSAPRIPMSPGRSYKIVLHRKRLVVDIVEAEDINFRYDSALMLPTVIPVSELENELPKFEENLLDDTLKKQRAAAGLSVIKGILRFYDLCLKRQEQKKLLITGHTDTRGSDSYNEKLSLNRANVVRDIILGDKESRESFAKTVDDNHDPKDQQHVLKWIAKTLSWPDVDPGKVDGEYGIKTSNAIIAFKRNMKSDWKFPPTRYDTVPLAPDMAELITALKSGSYIGVGAWEVIFELYQAEIRLSLMEDGIDLDDLRSRLQWVDDDKKAVGCGETWTLEARGFDNYKSQINRRVEILFYDPEELEKPLPCKDSDCAEDDCHVFKNIDRYDPEKGCKEVKLGWRYIPIDEDGKIECDTVVIWLLDRLKKPVPEGTPYRITIGDIVRVGKCAKNGLVVEKNVHEQNINIVKVEWGELSQWNYRDVLEEDLAKDE